MLFEHLNWPLETFHEWYLCIHPKKQPPFHQVLQRMRPHWPQYQEAGILYDFVIIKDTRIIKPSWISVIQAPLSMVSPQQTQNNTISHYMVDILLSVTRPHICLAARSVLEKLRSYVWSDGHSPDCSQPSQTYCTGPTAAPARIYGQTLALGALLTSFSFSCRVRSLTLHHFFN